MIEKLTKQLQIILNKSIRCDHITLSEARDVAFKDKNGKIHTYHLAKGVTVLKQPDEDIAKDIYLFQVIDNMILKDSSLLDKIKKIDHEELIIKDQMKMEGE